MKIQKHASSIEFLDMVTRNIGWEGEEFNNGYHLRVTDKYGPYRAVFDFWPSTRCITEIGSNVYDTIPLLEDVEVYIKNKLFAS